MGLANGRIGIEMDYLPAGDFATLRKALPSATFSAAEHHFARSRQFKTPDEITLLRKLSRIADSSITDAFASVNVGSSELDIAAAMTRGLYTQGADQFRLMIVATGERSVFPNVGPTERKLAPQDVCRVEIFSMLNGYHAGVCRTAVVESAPQHAERIWENLVACKYLILDMIKPGASSRAIYEAFLRKLSELDLPPISFVGHGIGLHLHEDPYLGKYSDTPLEAGMVLGIEPLVYRTPYGFGMQNKDVVLVTDRGSELLSDYANTDRLLVVQ
jgi:Xaa-Pro aminopeptidase